MLNLYFSNLRFMIFVDAKQAQGFISFFKTLPQVNFSLASSVVNYCLVAKEMKKIGT